MSIKRSVLTIAAILSICSFLNASKKMLIQLEAEYLAYSYDYNQIYGEQVKFKFFSYEVYCNKIKIDIPSRSFYAYGSVVLKKNDDILSGDEFLFNPEQNKGVLINFGEEINIKQIGEKDEDENSLIKNNVLHDLNLLKIQKSFIYFTGRLFEITLDFEVYGYNVTFYVEGLQSLGFKKFKMSEGIKQRTSGVALDKIWYTKSRGLIVRANYLYEKKDKINSLTQVTYEERSVVSNYIGPNRQVDIMTSSTFNINENLNLGLSGNYNSSNLWNVNFWLNKKWKKNISTNLDFSYNKPINFKGEAWLGLQTALDSEKFGNFAISGRFGNQNQVLGNLSYGKTFFNALNFRLVSSFSKIKIAGSSEFSEILSGSMSLSYNSKIFDLSTDYYLNSDLIGNQLLSQPQLRIGLNPISFYGGILSASITNIFIYNRLKGKDSHEDTYSNNTIFNLSTQPIFILKTLQLNFNIAVEQLVEKEGRNFTSGGIIINANKEFFKGFNIEFFYSIQSRRKTKNWLIEGTTSQDLSTILRINPNEKLYGWISISYDPKNSEWRQSFADVSIGIAKNWKFHSLFNYDFLLKKINNVDLYLIRDAGRFQLRFIWRSISKQFLVELVPR